MREGEYGRELKPHRIHNPTFLCSLRSPQLPNLTKMDLHYGINKVRMDKKGMLLLVREFSDVTAILTFGCYAYRRLEWSMTGAYLA